MLFASCSSDNESELLPDVPTRANFSHTAEKTVVVYVSGENSLSDYINADIAEMLQGSCRIGENNLLVYVDRSDSKELPWLARMYKGRLTDSVSVADMGISKSDIYSSEPKVFEGVLRRLAQRRTGILICYYPSEAYITWLNLMPEIEHVDTIDCGDLFNGKDERERIEVFRLRNIESLGG